MDTYNELKQDIKTHEGYRDHIYKDSLGLSTIFWGHLILPTDEYIEGINYSIEAVSYTHLTLPTTPYV